MDLRSLSTSSGAEEACCLCRPSVMEASALVKRKKFHGKACESSKELINHILMENFKLTVLSFREMNNSNAYLCHQCDTEASKCLKLQDQIIKIKDNILSMVSNLTSLPTVVMTRKRPSSVRDSAEISNLTFAQSESYVKSSTASQSDVTTIGLSQMSADVSMNVPLGLVEPPPSTSTGPVSSNVRTSPSVMHCKL